MKSKSPQRVVAVSPEREHVYRLYRRRNAYGEGHVIETIDVMVNLVTQNIIFDEGEFLVSMKSTSDVLVRVPDVDWFHVDRVEVTVVETRYPDEEV